MNEPELMANDLEERLKTASKRCEIALILLGLGKDYLLPTILEDLHLGTQMIMDIYCISSPVD